MELLKLSSNVNECKPCVGPRLLAPLAAEVEDDDAGGDHGHLHVAAQVENETKD
jgi:hypothetical protein